MANIHVDIVAAEGSIYSGEATMVFAPAAMGEVGIAPRHAPLLTTMKPGTVRVQNGSEEHAFFVGGGILEVQPHLVTVLADTALRAKDVDEAAATRAKQEAETKLAGAKSQMDLKIAQNELIEASARLEYIEHLKKTSR
jgi:F-type H+-transporting ATPase subunit epsilon